MEVTETIEYNNVDGWLNTFDSVIAYLIDLMNLWPELKKWLNLLDQ